MEVLLSLGAKSTTLSSQRVSRTSTLVINVGSTTLLAPIISHQKESTTSGVESVEILLTTLSTQESMFLEYCQVPSPEACLDVT